MNKDQLPPELLSIVRNYNYDISESTASDDFPNKRFITFSVKSAQLDEEVDVQIVEHLTTNKWEFIYIAYKNCIYQDAPDNVMLSALNNLMAGHLVHEKTWLKKKDKLVITDDTSKAILRPYTIS